MKRLLIFFSAILVCGWMATNAWAAPASAAPSPSGTTTDEAVLTSAADNGQPILLVRHGHRGHYRGHAYRVPHGYSYRSYAYKGHRSHWRGYDNSPYRNYSYRYGYPYRPRYGAYRYGVPYQSFNYRGPRVGFSFRY